MLKTLRVLIAAVLSVVALNAMADDDDGLPSLPVGNGPSLNSSSSRPASGPSADAAKTAIKNSYYKTNPIEVDLNTVYGQHGEDPNEQVQECGMYDSVHNRCIRYKPTKWQMKQTIKAGIDVGMKGRQLLNDINSQIYGANRQPN